MYLIVPQKVSQLLKATGLTIDEDNGFLDGILVVELGVQQSLVNEGAIESALVPSNVQVVNVDMTETPHHFHLVVHCEKEQCTMSI